jgi:hypothetical protein
MGDSSYALSAWLFLRLLALVHVVAFASLAVQIRGLAGCRGIVPAVDRRSASSLNASENRAPWLVLPASDLALVGRCWLGVAVAIALALGLAPVVALLVLSGLYVSLLHICGVFLGYQWDALLVEMSVLAVLLAPPVAWSDPAIAYAPPWIARWLLVWLLFRLVLSSGVVKLRSGDAAWRSLTALRHHFETQPLPNMASWRVHHLPPVLLSLAAAGMFAIELGAPWLLLCGAPWSHAGAAAIALLMVSIQATGSFGFFNVQTLVLCTLLFDDERLRGWLGGVLPGSLATASGDLAGAEAWSLFGALWPTFVALVGAALFALSLVPVAHLFRRDGALPAVLQAWYRRLAPLRIVNAYGLFAVMTTSRPEIVVEGSEDGVTWHAYEFRWKPGDPARAPRFAAPHQPRLDWQMWFAALSSERVTPWFTAFLTRLLEASPEVLTLLARDPFAGRRPRVVRALLYDYRFTTRAERAASGQWWSRRLVGLYHSAISLE